VRALILGGTFNPVHCGHLFLALDARGALGYETVILVPALLPVHKDPAPVIAAAHRLAMLELAVHGLEGILVDDCEIRRGGPSYSIDTVRELVARRGIDGRPGFLVGEDLLAGFGAWKDPDALARETELIVVRRSRGATNTGGQTPSFDWPHRTFANTILPISSSEIRSRAADGRTIRFLVPDAVASYITAHKLYG
jgi:nicotinate-nucleotide adenylyltransferase